MMPPAPMPIKQAGSVATKRRRGRPSVALAQRPKIIEAFVKAMRRYGLAGATVDRVAKSLGISRTLIFHYFGDMKVLTRAVVEYIAKTSIRDLTSTLENLSLVQRRKALVDFTVEGPHFGQLRDAAVLADVDSLAAHDAGVAAMVAEMWELQIGAVVEAVASSYPEARRADCEAVG